ncbi:hypothetical protein [Escherichia coli]
MMVAKAEADERDQV